MSEDEESGFVAAGVPDPDESGPLRDPEELAELLSLCLSSTVDELLLTGSVVGRSPREVVPDEE
jgi:hypothetical protein